MKKFILVIILFISVSNIYANHISGGEMTYQYMGPGSAANTKKYLITLKLFRDNLGGGAQMPANVYIGIFVNGSFAKVNGSPFDISRNSTSPVPVDPPPLCMTNPPQIDYSMGIYEFTIDLPNTPLGYTCAYQTCCRITPLANVYTQSQPAQGEGSTYVCTIPGTSQLAGNNSSPQFKTQLGPVCYNNTFTFDFSAIDIDGDSLVYSFCDAYNRGNAVNSSNVDPSTPPYQSVVYINGYSSGVPLGTLAHLNPQTGLITGIAPPAGRYVVCVCIDEYRNKVLIGHHRKDFVLTVSDCNIARADLNPEYHSCDGFTVDFENNAPAINIQTYLWDFGDGTTSSLPNPSHTYLLAGDYILKLVVNRGLACSDSATSVVKVYPGFFPDFNFSGQCTNLPIQFNDLTTANYGVINFWSWNFGDLGSPTNTSSLKNPTHTYTTANSYDVTFIVSSSKGCIDTLHKTIDVLTSPPLTLTKDTLICVIDTLQLNAVGSGTFLWTPNYMISNVNIGNPLVSPDVTTTYHVTLTDPFGCYALDSVKIRVVNAVTQAGNYDTTICSGDPVRLRLISDALTFNWTPANGTLSSTTIQNPIAITSVTTTYHVVGSISAKCFAENDIKIIAVPFPKADAGPDIPVCFGNSTQLNATGGSIYSWSPTLFLNNSHIPNPTVINPTGSVRYIVTVTDVLGCPKPVRDTVIVRVIKINPIVHPSDTSVVLGQPLQLGASGGSIYTWSPATWLNDPNISTPISLPQNNITYSVKVSDANGCTASALVHIRVYFVKPDFFVPTAFSPNGDNLNENFRPILIGMKSLDDFKVFNRWGQQLYSNAGNSITGWDGSFGGRPQEAGTYVWIAQGTDYLNKIVKKKGYVVLIR